MRPEGFYRVRYEGLDGVAICQHLNPSDNDVYESWSILFLRDYGIGKDIPAHTVITTRDERTPQVLEVIRKLR